MNKSRPPVFRRVLHLPGAIKFQESVFALPFAYSGMVLAADGLPTWQQFLWITIAMVSARTLGMAANRIIDHHIDVENPRTSQRHLPRGLVLRIDMWALTIISGLIFFIAAAQLNSLALLLAPIAAAYLILYPFTKRFTWAANFLLGWALAIAPSAAWIGVTGNLSWEPILLSTAVALWAGSFDILYHVQDIDFYRARGLHSVAERFGVKSAFRVSATLDAAAIVCLIGVGFLVELPYPYYLGTTFAAGVMAYKYKMVSPNNLSRMNTVFGRTNAIVSTMVFSGTLVSVVAL